jgi:hypothetical protein
MRFSIGTIFRIFALAAVAVTVASCDGNGSRVETSAPGANLGNNTIVATVPEPPAPDTASLRPANQVLTISKAIFDDYQVYLGRVGRIGSGYYAVTEDGLGGASWSCGDALCGDSYNGKAAALTQCETSNPGKSCIIFAKDNHPQIKYDLAQ